MTVYLVVRDEVIFRGDLHNVVSCWETKENAEAAVESYTVGSPTRFSYSVIEITVF